MRKHIDSNGLSAIPQITTKREFRTQTISTRVTEEQYQLLLLRAKEQGLKVSEYLRVESLAAVESRRVLQYQRALMAEVCSLRTIIAYTVANLTTGRKIDATFMKALFAEADAMKHEEANLRLGQARLRQSDER